MSDPVLVTGAAGFIGFAFARRLLESGRPVIGVDNLNPYYDPALKEARLDELRQFSRFSFRRLDLADRVAAEELFRTGTFGPVVHLAAQAGVRYSLENPHAYLDANLAGFLNVLEGCRHRATPHLVFASSSSVYGANTGVPFSEHHPADHPISLYAATKRANELMAHSYAWLYQVPMTGLRFFTVYGPWGRPDMAPGIFARAIASGEPIRLFNHGNMRRDFTYIDDVVAAMERLIERPPAADPDWNGAAPDPATGPAPWRIYNIGGNLVVEVTRFLDLLEQAFGRKAKREYLPMQPGDVPETRADTADLAAAVGIQPATAIEDGVDRFVAWYRAYHRLG
jgi:UDP-glucuronate 4-epimerase